MSNGPTGLSLIVATLLASSGCIRLPAGDASDSKPGTAARKAATVVVWDGDEHGGGAGLGARSFTWRKADATRRSEERGDQRGDDE